jgi:hypothetical protein
MLLVQVNAKLQAALERDVSMVDMFRHPTVGALARHLSGEGAAATLSAHFAEKAASGRSRLAALRNRRKSGPSEAE